LAQPSASSRQATQVSCESAALADSTSAWSMTRRRKEKEKEGEKRENLFKSFKLVLIPCFPAPAVQLVCMDIEYPEPARVLALAGMDLLLVPTALGGRFLAVVPANYQQQQQQ
jgi:hypothetical protein